MPGIRDEGLAKQYRRSARSTTRCRTGVHGPRRTVGPGQLDVTYLDPRKTDVAMTPGLVRVPALAEVVERWDRDLRHLPRARRGHRSGAGGEGYGERPGLR